MLQVQKVNQFYDQSHILWNLDFDLEEGKCTCLMGRNGVGKTTAIKCILGLLPIKDGGIVFDGNNISKKTPEWRAKSGIGYVPQGRDIFPQLTVAENLEVSLIQKRSERDRLLKRIYTLFPVLKEMLHRRGGDLSGGQQQQLAIGRALALDPKLLVLDEPTEGIQPNIVSQIADVINHLCTEEGLTILVVEQKLKFVRKVADNFHILEKGRNVASGTVDELSQELIDQYLCV